MLPQKCRRQKRRRLNSRIEGRYALRIPPRLTVSAGVVSGIRLRSFLRCLLFSFTLDYTLINVYWLPTIRATIEINRSNPSRAIELLKVAVPYELGLVPANLEVAALLYPVHVRGQTYLLLHDGNKATVEFQKFLDHPPSWRTTRSSHSPISASREPMPCRATPPRPRWPIRISSRFGKTPTLTFLFSSRPRRSTQSCNSSEAKLARIVVDGRTDICRPSTELLCAQPSNRMRTRPYCCGGGLSFGFSASFTALFRRAASATLTSDVAVTSASCNCTDCA
jgi:hypothetical protein